MLPNRELGEDIPLSIATARPFEVQITNPAVNLPEILGINLSTLWRNFYEAFDSSEFERGNTIEILNAFYEEFQTVAGLCRQANVGIFFYHINYNVISKKLPNAIEKDRSTPKLFDYDRREAFYIEKLKALNEKADNSEAIAFSNSLKLPNLPRKAWLLTHQPLDLLSRYMFNTMMLIESHTGAVKGPFDWISKLTTNPDYVRLPFNTLTLQIFGDGINIASYKDELGGTVKYRKRLLAVAEERRWTAATTRSKILSDLKAQKDPLCDRMITLFVNL